MKKLFYVALVLGVLSFTSCEADEIEQVDEVNSGAVNNLQPNGSVQ